jgi:hypothetical protein
LSTLVLSQATLSPTHLAMWPLGSQGSVWLNLLGRALSVVSWLAVILVHVLVVISKILLLLELRLSELD